MRAGLRRDAPVAEEVVRLRLADLTYPAGHRLARQKGVVYGFAVRHPEGVFLFDTGIGAGHPWIDEHYRPRVRDVGEALTEAGLTRLPVIAVANSHLHFDHCGQNRRFPQVPIYVQSLEGQAAQAEGYTVTEWVDFPGARYELLEGDAEPLNGVRLLATPGHTSGHQSAAVTTSAGVVVLAGHAIFSAAEWRGDVAASDSSPAARASADRLRALAPRRVFFSHDDAVWERET